jgi:hypothetical protein
MSNFFHILVGAAINAAFYFGGFYFGKATELKRLKIFFELQPKLLEFDNSMKDFPHRQIWKCYICEESRINACISVARYTDLSKFCQINIKHCNDNKECIDKAHSLAYWKGDPVMPL